MFRFNYCKLLLLGIPMFLAACTVNDDKSEDYLFEEKPALVFETNPEPADEKMDVYGAIARAVKYNVDVVGRSLHKRVNEDKVSMSPEKLMKKIENANVRDENILYKGLRMLDFALIYANANLGATQKYADNYYYEAAAKYLTLEAIRAHQSVWFADRKERLINSLIRQEHRIVSDLNLKELKHGSLTDEEYDYANNQKVLLLKLKDLWNFMNSERQAYIDLVKLDPPQVELEGRRFYALENFDEDYTLELFQEAAVRNRKEFALAKEYSQLLPYSQVRRYISNSYPPVARLDVNGVKVEYDIYKQELYEKAASIAQKLVSLVYEYKNSKNPLKDKSLKEIFDEIGAAVLTQVEVSYQLVMLADYEYENWLIAAESHKKELQRLKKIRHPTNADKLALFKAKITEIKLEQRKSQIFAERAEALRGLYFNAGLSPIKISMLRLPVKDVAADIKKSFNHDLVEMLANVKVQLNSEHSEYNAHIWTAPSDWLENVASEGKKQNKDNTEVINKQKVIAVKKENVAPVVVQKTNITKNNTLTKPAVIQLGAYLESKNADEDWEEIILKFPELKNHKKNKEKTVINGKNWERLQVSGDANVLAGLCDKIKKQGYDCFLK